MGWRIVRMMMSEGMDVLCGLSLHFGEKGNGGIVKRKEGESRMMSMKSIYFSSWQKEGREKRINSLMVRCFYP